MKQVTHNEINFSELFRFAKEYSGIDWNSANNLFFDARGGVLRYKHFNDFEICEVKNITIENSCWCETEQTIQCKSIIYEFMKKNKVDSIRIFND